jgi:hypothetical protein
MAKEVIAPVKKTTTVSLTTKVSGRPGISIIERGNKLPDIYDKTPNAVEWLKANGYAVKDIELIGDKPANWDSVFEIEPSTDVPS